MNDEIWKEIPEYEGLYECSTFGNIRSLDRIVNNTHNSTRFIKGTIKTKTIGNYYYYVDLYKNNVRVKFNVHQLVAITFLNHKPDGFKKVVDHINEDKLDNRLENLRIVSHSDNLCNSSKPRGYSLHKYTNKYHANIRKNNKNYSLGYFNTKEEAHNAYLLGKEKYHNINKI